MFDLIRGSADDQMTTNRSSGRKSRTNTVSRSWTS